MESAITNLLFPLFIINAMIPKMFPMAQPIIPPPIMVSAISGSENRVIIIVIKGLAVAKQLTILDTLLLIKNFSLPWQNFYNSITFFTLNEKKGCNTLCVTTPSSFLSVNPCSLSKSWIENLLTNTNIFWCDFQKLICINEL